MASTSADQLDQWRRDAYDYSSSSDRLGVVISRAIEMLMVVKRKGIGAENLKFAVDSLTWERNLALGTEKIGDIALRVHVYRLCEALEITMKSVVEARTEQPNVVAEAVENETVETTIEAKQTFTIEMPEVKMEDVEVKEEAYDPDFAFAPSDPRLEQSSLSLLSTQAIIVDRKEDVVKLGEGVVKEEQGAEEFQDERSEEASEEYVPMEEDYEEATSSTANSSERSTPAVVDPNECPKCGARFVRTRDLRRHLRTIDHSVKQHVRQFNPDRVRRYKCDKCPAEFTRIDNLNRHRGTHTGRIKRIECPHCDVMLTSNLNGHLRQVHGIDPYVCDYCGEAFGRLAQLKEHNSTCAG